MERVTYKTNGYDKEVEMRLIDADALMRKFAEFVRRSNNSDFAKIPTWNDAVSLLESAPTIDPVKHGKWLKLGDCGTVQCSECFDYINELCYLCHGQELPNYCQNCGAKMDRNEE